MRVFCTRSIVAACSPDGQVSAHVEVGGGAPPAGRLPCRRLLWAPALLLLLCSQALAQTDGSVSFKVRTVAYTNGQFLAHALAIWVSDSTNAFVKTLTRRALAVAPNYFYANCLTNWLASTAPKYNSVDAITGATISAQEGHQTHYVSWDCRNAAGKLMPDGLYRILVEFTQDNTFLNPGNTNKYRYTGSNYITFTKGPARVSLTPTELPDLPNFKDMNLVYTPLSGSIPTNSLVFWMRGDLGITADTTNLVARWADSTGNRNHAWALSANSEPLWTNRSVDNKPALVFDGRDDAMTVSNAAAINSGGPWTQKTVVVLFRTGTNITSRQALWEEGGSGKGLATYIDAGRLYAGGWDLNNEGDGTTPWGPKYVSWPLAPGASYYVELILNQPAGLLQGYLNGSAGTNVTGAGRLYAHTDPIGLGYVAGGTYFHDGVTTGGFRYTAQIDDIMGYNVALTDTNRAQVKEYFAFRYALPYADRDHDGLSDNWENSYFKGTNKPSGGPTQDFDGDGFSNLAEWQSGTDPTNPASALALLNVRIPSPTGSTVVVRWQSASNHLYSLYKATNLVQGFRRVVSNLPPAAPINVYTDAFVSVTSIYYRVTTQEPEWSPP